MNTIESALHLVAPTNQTLRSNAAEVLNIESQVVPHLAAMKGLMRANGGVGLAAPQVGIGLRFFITEINPIRLVINPRIVSSFGPRVSKSEGCLTWPNRSTFVARQDGVVVEFTDRNGQRKTATLVGWEARVFQHENDHLNGVCIFP